MDTRKKKKYMEGLTRRMGFDNVHYVEPQGLSGGLCLWWNNKVNLVVNKSSPNFVDVAVQLEGSNFIWQSIFVYGCPNQKNRRDFWNQLHDISSPSIPCIFVGDFNSIASQDDKWGGADFSFSQARDMHNFIEFRELMDLECKGPYFTWFNKQFGRVAILERLDRALASIEWKEAFPKAYVLNEALIESDHSPLVLCLDGFQTPKKQFSFKFEAKWMLHSECQAVTSSAWNQQIIGSPMFSIMKKLKFCRIVLSK
ncbi:uncharacterized protein LOC131178706 [Hevea brasiliensis]|uniref:uncharacterized protein LOC131178706 n=1 Tax=Hevea brasiliensis TaxID=3981 RepID=UPI0025F790AA|nr:uncharacterized protein LOC131178706 [Hevea brasiliensis]